MVDNLLVICAFLFLCATYLAFWALRTRRATMTHRLSRAMDGAFLVALTALVSVAFLMVDTIL